MNIMGYIKNYDQCKGYYTPDRLEEFIKEIGYNFKIIKTNKKIQYYNIPCSFDIETTSFKEPTQIGSEKRSIMYEWTLGINFVIMIGRTWEELLRVFEEIETRYGLYEERRMIFYIHNLSFEFQAFRKWFEWFKVFSIDKRKPVQAITLGGIEFRCSYILSGYSLDKLSNQLLKYKVKKQTGSLNYDLIRHSYTPLTEQEIKYCLFDVLVVMCYIQEKIEREGDITRIPLTKTGYVRRHCRNSCYYEDKSHKKSEKFKKYYELMQQLTITEEEYVLLKQAFAGGFTHANPYYSTGVFTNVDSFDETSAYPYVMVSEQFPMSKGKKVSINSYNQLEEYMEKYCCLLDIAIKGLEPKVLYDNYISVSHCRKLKNGVENNGRLVSADYLETTITEQDYYIMRHFYSWEDMEIRSCYIYKKAYLPTDFVKSILQLYVDKTKLKGVDGKEYEYGISKENVNSCYGMCVTDICKEENIYMGEEWSTEPPNIKKLINRNNRSKKRFLFYPWGVWVTAYARFNLFLGINEFNEDYIYSDTDSIKGKNIEKHIKFIETYNKLVSIKLKKACEHHKIPFDMVAPKTIKGETKMLGIWEHEIKKPIQIGSCGHSYKRFKTLGSKRYLVETDDGYQLTVSGLGKKKALDYMIKTFGDKIFDNFNEGLYIPPNHTGKMTHTYIDFEVGGEVEDYLGNKSEYYEKSGTHLQGCEYDLSMSQKYINYILGIKEMIE